MTTPADTYRKLSAAFTDVVEKVPADIWSAPSPCAEWTAREVLQHVINTERESVKPGEVALEPGPSPDDDPLAAWDDTQNQIQAVLNDSDKAGIEFKGYFGATTLGQSIEDFYCVDLVVHRWDIAKATGGDTAISDDEIAFVRGKLEMYGDAMRMPGVFGAAVEVPDDADEQTKLLAFIGRRA